MHGDGDRKTEVLVVLDVDVFLVANGLLDEVEQVVDPDRFRGGRDEFAAC